MTYTNIKTERLILEVYSADDLTELSESLTDEEIKIKLGFTTEEQINKHKEMYQQGFSSYNHSLVLIQLKLKTTGEIIGSCGYHHWDAQHRRADVGYWHFTDAHKRMGYMGEALKAVLKFGFKDLNLHRIDAHINRNNTPSLKLVKANGFVEEGCLRKNYLIDGVFNDSLIFSLLEDEYNTI